MIRSHLAPTRLLLSLVIFSLLSTVTITVARAPQAHATSPDDRTISTTMSGDAYDVLVGGQKVASVPVSDPAHTVWTTISSDGERLALIADYNSGSGDGLHLADVGTGTMQLVDPGRVTSASFSPDSARLAYVLVADGSAELRITDGAKTGGTVAQVAGRDVTVLGWDDRGESVYLVRYPDTQFQTPSLAKMTISSGELRDLFTSGDDGVYRDFRVVTIAGRHHLSFIRAEQDTVCGGKQRLVLAGADGTVVKEFGQTEDSYGRAIWSGDGTTVAYEAQACISPDEASSPDSGTERLASYNGTYVADLTTGQAQRVVAGLSSTHTLQGTGAAGVQIGSARTGVITIANETVQKGGAVPAESLAQAPDASVAVTRIWAPYVNQRWDTPLGFTGESACGPTSAVMTLGGRELSESSTWANKNYGAAPAPHWTDYGRYVTDTYQHGQTTFNRTAQDWNFTGAWAGAYGWMIEPVCGPQMRPCTVWAKLTDFLQRHGRDVSFREASATAAGSDAAWVRAQLDAGKLVIVSGKFRWGAIDGHLSVITGYTSDGRFYVHDSYGPQTDGTYNGADQIYTWDYMRPKAFWASGSNSSTTSRISLPLRTTQGASGVRPEADNDSRYPSISHDGRYLAFESTATNLVNGDTNGKRDIFVRDRTTGTTNRASVTGSGASFAEGNGDSSEPVISGDGRYVAFQSQASNLGGGYGIYVRDMPGGTTTRLGTGLDPAISADGRYVAYSSLFDPNDPVVGGQSFQIVVYDRSTGQKDRVSVNGSGQLGNQRSYRPTISGDGRYVAFSSTADNLDGNPTGGHEHVYIRDRQAGTTVRASKALGGAPVDGGSAVPALSADGRYVAYESSATNLVNGDTNGRRDLFRSDRITGSTVRVNVNSLGEQAIDSANNPSISSDGRQVAFHSNGRNLVPFDEGYDTDIFVHDTATGATRRVSTASGGAEANNHSYNAAISGDGRTIAFDSLATNLVAHDTAGKRDIFVHGPLAQAIVIDNYSRNNDGGLTKVEATGTWRPSTYVGGYWATGYQVGNEAEAVPGNFTFKFYLPSGGQKSIDAWWTEGPNRTTRASYTVKDSSGTTRTVAADQQRGGSRWITLGAWDLPAGWTTVTLSSAGGSGVVIADAIRVR